MKFCWILIIDKFVIIHRSDDGLYDRKAFYTVKIVFYSSSIKFSKISVLKKFGKSY